jgi:hypothetical protein
LGPIENEWAQLFKKIFNSPDQVDGEEKNPWHDQIVRSNTPSPPEDDNSWHITEPVVLYATPRSIPSSSHVPTITTSHSSPGGMLVLGTVMSMYHDRRTMKAFPMIITLTPEDNHKFFENNRLFYTGTVLLNAWWAPHDDWTWKALPWKCPSLEMCLQTIH